MIASGVPQALLAGRTRRTASGLFIPEFKEAPPFGLDQSAKGLSLPFIS
jgi:hypothetical protein